MLTRKADRSFSGQEDQGGFFHQSAGYRYRVEDLADYSHSGKTAAEAVNDGGIHFHFSVQIQNRTITAVEFRRVFQRFKSRFYRLDTAFGQKFISLQSRFPENLHELPLAAGIQPAVHCYNAHIHIVGNSLPFYVSIVLPGTVVL